MPVAPTVVAAPLPSNAPPAVTAPAESSARPDAAEEPSPSSAHEALIQFLYQAPVGLLQARADGEITMINPMSAQLLMPLARGGDLGNLFDLLDPFAPQLRRLASAVGPGAAMVCEDLRIELPASPDGRVPGRTLSIGLFRIDADTLMGSVSDASATVWQERQQLSMKLRDASRVDVLTSLPNRAVVMERIAAVLARAHADADYRYAVLVMNCDRFDRVNVTLGPATGDALLRLVGERLSGLVRTGDGVGPGGNAEAAAASLGGDEFVLVVRDMRETDDAHGVARRVVEALARPYTIGDRRVHVSASVGVVVRAQASGDAEDVLQQASMAMHEAKRAGGDRYHFYDPVMKSRAAQRGGLEADLRIALGESQLFLVYQPIVELATGACVGTEALVRWRHPVRGIVSPVEFIGIAEETGLISALGGFVLTNACQQQASWRRELQEAAPATVSVNLSKAQLLECDFASRVRDVLAASGLPAACLQLEVTESLAAQDAGVQAQLHALKALGLTLALDDFGTGYSSLSSLHQLPVDVVKIDRSFVAHTETSRHHRVLVEATVKVAQSLGMRTVAEGIETPGQLDELTRLGCDKAQGYLLSKPMTSADATRWLAAHAQRRRTGTPAARAA